MLGCEIQLLQCAFHHRPMQAAKHTMQYPFFHSSGMIHRHQALRISLFGLPGTKKNKEMLCLAKTVDWKGLWLSLQNSIFAVQFTHVFLTSPKLLEYRWSSSELGRFQIIWSIPCLCYVWRYILKTSGISSISSERNVSMQSKVHIKTACWHMQIYTTNMCIYIYILLYIIHYSSPIVFFTLFWFQTKQGRKDTCKEKWETWKRGRMYIIKTHILGHVDVWLHSCKFCWKCPVLRAPVLPEWWLPDVLMTAENLLLLILDILGSRCLLFFGIPTLSKELGKSLHLDWSWLSET